MLKAWFKKYKLKFKSPMLTSRGEMKVKNGYYIFVSDGVKTGTGECSYIEGLSVDDLENYENSLRLLCRYIETGQPEFLPVMGSFPSIRFGWETAMADLENGGRKILFESDFTKGNGSIPINGLVWMGTQDFMLQQISRKIIDGFKCIKIKVGAIPFDEEIALLAGIRKKFPAEVIEIRLDANGAFNRQDIFKALETFSAYSVHSIEQPVKPGQIELMKEVCANSPIPVALDEELVHLNAINAAELLQVLKPAYIILKPSLIGGFKVCADWIKLATENKIGWWATSALESNIGLNAIAQWTFIQNNTMAQGLGTGELYEHNVNSPLYVRNGMLHYSKTTNWGEI